MALKNTPKSILPTDEPISISRDQITMLMLESYKKSSTSAEEIMCLREVAKIHGFYDVKATTQVNILNVKNNIQKLEALTDEELLQLAGHGSDLFKQIQHQEQVEGSIEADYEEVTDE